MADKEFLRDVYELKSVADTKALYDDWSASYDTEVSDNGYVTPTRIATALAKMLPDLNTPVLDFGCGSGRVVTHLKNTNAKYRFYGTDIDDEAIAWCQQYIANIAEFSTNNEYPPLDFPDNYFDLLYSISVFQ